MLNSIHLLNFRGFKDHLLPLRQQTIMVGANNAGKSTAIEAVRLVSLVANRYKNLNYSHPSPESHLPGTLWVASPSLENFNINFDNLCYNLGDPPAVITAQFTGGEITIYLVRTQKLYAIVRNPAGQLVRNKTEASKVDLDQVHILPQVAPLARDEQVLTDNYVRAHVSSALAPLHFRNQLRLMAESYAEFVRLVAETWPGLRVMELVNAGNLPDRVLGLLVQDGEFCAEVAWMGHGVQMWLQTIWFLARTATNTCVVFDEPDVYLHPDLQRRLIKLVRPRYRQVVVATHSIEIMSEVDPHDVLIIDRHQDKSWFADAHPVVQRFVDHIGSSQNINLARLHATKKFLLFEGEDLNLITRFHALLFRDSPNSLASLPNLPIGGWGGWNVVIGSEMALHNYVGGKITMHCILDSDHHTPKQISDRYEEAKRRDIQLHIWTRKEIENYLLIPEAISRVIQSRVEANNPSPAPQEICAQIEAIVERFKGNALDQLGQEFLNDDKKGGFPSASRHAQDLIDAAWRTRESRWGRISGKDILSELSKWSQEHFGISFGAMTVLRELRENEIPKEMADVVTAIERGNPLTPIRDAYTFLGG